MRIMLIIFLLWHNLVGLKEAVLNLLSSLFIYIYICKNLFICFILFIIIFFLTVFSFFGFISQICTWVQCYCSEGTAAWTRELDSCDLMKLLNILTEFCRLDTFFYQSWRHRKNTCYNFFSFVFYNSMNSGKHKHKVNLLGSNLNSKSIENKS